VAEHLTPEWLAALAAAGARATVPDHVQLVVQQVVVDDDGTEVAYVVRVEGGRIAVEPGRSEDAQVTFTQDRATAAAIAAGSLSAQAAFLDGRLRVGGDLSLVLSGARDLAVLDDVFAGVHGAGA
jgi:predicted lipid carrier protein YhbT